MTTLTLYHLNSCPFCIRVRIAMQKMGIELPLKEISDTKHRQALIKGGGRSMVPCLKIETKDQPAQWLYESSDIIAFLKQHITKHC